MGVISLVWYTMVTGRILRYFDKLTNGDPSLYILHYLYSFNNFYVTKDNKHHPYHRVLEILWYVFIIYYYVIENMS